MIFVTTLLWVGHSFDVVSNSLHISLSRSLFLFFACETNGMPFVNGRVWMRTKRKVYFRLFDESMQKIVFVVHRSLSLPVQLTSFKSFYAKPRSFILGEWCDTITINNKWTWIVCNMFTENFTLPVALAGKTIMRMAQE